jgi:hypothetical protein
MFSASEIYDRSVSRKLADEQLDESLERTGGRGNTAGGDCRRQLPHFRPVLPTSRNDGRLTMWHIKKARILSQITVYHQYEDSFFL